MRFPTSMSRPGAPRANPEVCSGTAAATDTMGRIITTPKMCPCSTATRQTGAGAFHQTENTKGRSVTPWSVNDYLLIKNEKNLQSFYQSDWQITGTTGECFNQINYVRPGLNSPTFHDF